MLIDYGRERHTREERKDQAFRIVQQRGDWVTLRTLVRMMGLKVTPYARAIVNELVDDGMFTKEYHETLYGLPVCTYRIAPEYAMQRGKRAAKREGEK